MKKASRLWFVAAALGLCPLLVLGSGGGPDERGRIEGGLSEVEAVACASRIAVGEVRSYGDSLLGAEVVTMRIGVSDWLKGGGEAARELVFTAPAGTWPGDGPYEVGERVLVMVQDRPEEPADVFRERSTDRVMSLAYRRGRIEELLPRAKRIDCPAFWRHRGDGRGSGRGDV